MFESSIPNNSQTKAVDPVRMSHIFCMMHRESHTLSHRYFRALTYFATYI